MARVVLKAYVLETDFVLKKDRNTHQSFCPHVFQHLLYPGRTKLRCSGLNERHIKLGSTLQDSLPVLNCYGFCLSSTACRPGRLTFAWFFLYPNFPVVRFADLAVTLNRHDTSEIVFSNKRLISGRSPANLVTESSRIPSANAQTAVSLKIHYRYVRLKEGTCGRTTDAKHRLETGNLGIRREAIKSFAMAYDL